MNAVPFRLALQWMEVEAWQVQCLRSPGNINGIKSSNDPINQRRLHLGAFALLE